MLCFIICSQLPGCCLQQKNIFTKEFLLKHCTLCTVITFSTVVIIVTPLKSFCTSVFRRSVPTGTYMYCTCILRQPCTLALYSAIYSCYQYRTFKSCQTTGSGVGVPYMHDQVNETKNEHQNISSGSIYSIAVLTLCTPARGNFGKEIVSHQIYLLTNSKQSVSIFVLAPEGQNLRRLHSSQESPCIQ